MTSFWSNFSNLYKKAPGEPSPRANTSIFKFFQFHIGRSSSTAGLVLIEILDVGADGPAFLLCLAAQDGQYH